MGGINMNLIQKRFVPDRVLNSQLFRQGGFGVYTGFLSATSKSAMLEEAAKLMASAQDNIVTELDSEEYRGGKPPRSFLSAIGGPILDAFYYSNETLLQLKQVTGLDIYQSGFQGTYSYYARQGDYLGLHRDIEMCDVAVLTCLYDSKPMENGGGALCLYPSRCWEPLSVIRNTPNERILPVQLMPGQTIVLYGGVVPHLVTPMAHEQVRIISVLCYRV
jgi:hypothetical protein